MGELLALAPVHWRGGSTHWPATSWVQMQWAGSQAQVHGAPPVVLHLSGAAKRRMAHATRQCQRTAAMCTSHCLSFQIAYAQRFGTCTPCKYKRSGVRHRHTPHATELAPWIGDWQGHLDEPRWRHVAQNEEDENQDSDSSAVIDEDPLAQPQTFSARAPRTQYLPPHHAEEETVEVYLERLLGSAPQRNSLPRRLGDTQSEDVELQKRRPQICLMMYTNRL